MNLTVERAARRLRSRGARTAALASIVALAAATALAACSSSSSSSSSSMATTSPAASASASATASTPAGVAYAEQQIVAALQAPTAPVPSAAIKDLSSLKGKTIYYVPISSDVPAFAITAAAMKTALASVGVNLDVCSGNFNPSQFSACFSQAIGAGAAAIVSDAIPYQLTGSLIKQASAKGIGVVVTDQDALPGRPLAKNIAYIPGNDEQYRLTQDWIIANSDGKANILELEATDSPTSTAATQYYAIPEVKAHCPGCTVTLLKFSSSNEQDLPSLVSAALLKNPDINYISPQYDQYVSFVIQGIQDANATSRVQMAASAAAQAGLPDVAAPRATVKAAGATSRVQMAASAAALSGLQDVASPSSTVKAEVADNQVYNGWIDADEAMRVALGQAAVSYAIPIRLFTSANIGSAALNNAGMASGSWFGSVSFEQQFKTLWGVS